MQVQCGCVRFACPRDLDAAVPDTFFSPLPRVSPLFCLDGVDRTFSTFAKAGEALTVTDPEEAWVFHVLSDDTATSAVWAAQRVPDDHMTVVANQYVIKEVRVYNVLV